MPRSYGLIGKSLSHSFSKRFFSAQFERQGSNETYENFEVPTSDALREFLKQPRDGYNVTIPYKEAIMPYLSSVSPIAAQIGAVNTLVFTNEGWQGHNTDHIGFVAPLLSHEIDTRPALILGTGGASKAVAFALRHVGIPYLFVSRRPELLWSEEVLEHWYEYAFAKAQLHKTTTLGDYDPIVDSSNTIEELDVPTINYEQVTADRLADIGLIINTTPVGTYPAIDKRPNLPYSSLNQSHHLYDLVYNPEVTAFLAVGKEMGSRTTNGLPMLQEQARASYALWSGIN